VNSEPLVSVVLPCYEAERFLVEALDSLLGQTYGKLEILALDDGSSDGTLRILEEFAARDGRVRVLRNEANQGVIRTLNRGVAEAMRAHPYGGTPDSLHAEDYEMFARMLDDGAGLCNIDEPLMTVRSDPGSVSVRHEEIQVENFVRCAARHLERTLGMRPEPAAQRVLVNRIDATVGGRDLREGLRWLDRIEREFLRREPGSAAEARRAADLQRVDILVQAALKGRADVRLLAAPLALRYGRRLLSPPARNYLAGKLR
jgi:glycosyltransferase involved in cell wall biosynthesis